MALFNYLTLIRGGGRSAPQFTNSYIAENFALLTHIAIHWLFVYVHYGPFAKKNYETYNRSARVLFSIKCLSSNIKQVSNKLEYILYSFKYLSLFGDNSQYNIQLLFALNPSVYNYHVTNMRSEVISSYIWLPLAISGYHGLSRAISG